MRSLLKVNHLVTILLTGIWAVLISCSPNEPLAGGSSTDVGSYTLGGVILYNNQAEPQADVVLRKSDHISTGAASDEDCDILYTTVTDEQGRFSFALDDTGRFALEAVNGDSLTAFVQVLVDGEQDTVSIGTEQLYAPTPVSGVLLLSDSLPTSGVVSVVGTDRYAPVGPDGAFHILSPRGNMTLHFSVDGDEVVSENQVNVTIGETAAVLDTVVLPGGCENWDCDSAAVRAILDSNGYTHIDVDSVSRTMGGSRITTLTLSDLPLSHFPDAFLLLSSVNKLNLSKCSLSTFPEIICEMTWLSGLDIEANQLTALPQAFENLKNLNELILSRNRFNELPPQIYGFTSLTRLGASLCGLTRLDSTFFSLSNLQYVYAGNNTIADISGTWNALQSLRTLNLSRNEIATVPAEIFNLPKLTNADFLNNQLCNISADIAEKLSVIDPDWETTQECN